MHACEAAGIADLTRWHALPAWVQNRWLGHVYARVTGRYDAPPPTKQGQSSGVDHAILAEIERRRSLA